MSLATLGAVSAATNELPLPDTSSLSLGEVLILSGGGGTTEAVVIRSIASGRNIGATVSRGALGTLRLAHATPTTVTIYDPSGGGGGGWVTVEVPPAAPVAVTNIVAPGATIAGGSADLAGVLQFRLLGPFTITFATADIVNPPDNGILLETIPANSLIRVVPLPRIAWDSTTPQLYVSLSPSISGPSSTLFDGDASAIASGAAVGALIEMAVLSPSSAGEVNFGFASVECGVYVAIYPAAGVPSAGETDIYILIATPAS